jgi:hypothetical protein
MSAVRRHRLAHMPFSDDLKLWLKADAITGVAEGAGVASWPDSSGHLYAAVQATGGLQPLLKNNVANGLAAVRFDGTDDEMALSFRVLRLCRCALLCSCVCQAGFNAAGPSGNCRC